MSSRFLILFLGFFLIDSATVRAQEPSPAKHYPKVIVVGLDAVSFNILTPMIQAGLTPTFAKIYAQGARGELKSIWPLRTPQVWTTIVTGKYPGQHRIWDHLSNTRYSPPKFRTAEKKILSTAQRQSKALWNILDAQSIRTFSVGWIASWPAEKLNHGIMLAPIVLLDSKKQVSIKGSFWRDAKRQVYPANLWPEVKKIIIQPEDLSNEDLKDFANVPSSDHATMKLPYMEKNLRALKWSVARAKTVEALSLHFLEQANPELMLFYFQCGDSLFHRYWIFHKSIDEIVERFKTHGIPTDHAAEMQKRYGRVVQACYQDMDKRIGTILEKAQGPDTLVLIVSDHGFGEAPFPHPTKTEPYGGNHRDDGVILAQAPWIQPGVAIEDASVLDIMPTLLKLFRQPIADDMPGKVLDALLDDATRAQNIPQIKSYEAKPQLKIPYKSGWPARKFRPLAEDK